MRTVGRDSGNRQPLRVLHVLEATLGGTRRYIEDIAAATAGMPVEMALAYSTIRADGNFKLSLERIQKAGWVTYLCRWPMLMNQVLGATRNELIAKILAERNTNHQQSTSVPSGRVWSCHTRPARLRAN